jgi:YD repeat-containing protein
LRLRLLGDALAAGRAAGRLRRLALVQQQPPSAAPAQARPLLTYSTSGQSNSPIAPYFDLAYRRQNGGQVTAGLEGGPTYSYSAPDGSNYYGPPPEAANALHAESDGGSTETQPDGSQFRYTNSGQLHYVRNPGGGRWTLSHDVSGRVSAVADPLGGRVTLAYGGSLNVLRSITDAAGRRTTLTTLAGPSGERISWPDGSSVTVTFTGLPCWQDALGRRTTLMTLGSTLTVRPPDGTRTTFTVTGVGTVVRWPSGGRTTLTYAQSGSGNLHAITDPTGARTSYSWAQGRLVAVQDALGNRTTFLHKTMPNRATWLSGLVLPTGGRYTILYNSSSQVSAALDPLGRRTSLVWNSQGQRAAVVNALSQRTSFLYSGAGQVTVVIDPLTGRRTLVYDSSGNQIAEVNAVGVRTSFAVDSYGNHKRIQDALGNITTFVRDIMGRVLAQGSRILSGEEIRQIGWEGRSRLS